MSDPKTDLKVDKAIKPLVAESATSVSVGVTAVGPTEIDANKPVVDPAPPPLASWSVSIEGSVLPAQIVRNARTADTAKYAYCKANGVVIQNQKFIITKV